MLYVLRILSVVIILVLFAGCAGEPSEPVLTEGYPEWMRIIPDGEGYYFGIGMDYDLNEGFLLSYKLEMKEMDVAMEKIVKVNDRNVETETFHRTLWTLKITFL